MSSSSQEQTTKSTNTSSTSPWEPQAAEIQKAFGAADNAFGKASTATAPQNFTAGMTPEQLATFRSMTGFGGDMAPAQAVSSAGQSAMGTGYGAAGGALNSMGAFDPSSTNNIGNTVNGAKTYASGLDINGAVKNAMLNGVQTARDVTLPGMESGAAGTGNINSSRTGLSEGLVQRGLAEQAAGLTADMTNNAYGTGAQLANNEASTNNSETLQNNTSQGYLGTNLGANGASNVGSGINDATNLFTLAAGGGAGLRAGDQAGLTNQLQQYTAQTNSPFDALNNFMNIIGNRMYGQNTVGSGTSNTQGTSTPSPLQTAGGLLSALSFV